MHIVSIDILSRISTPYQGYYFIKIGITVRREILRVNYQSDQGVGYVKYSV